MTYKEYISQFEIHYDSSVKSLRKRGFHVHHVKPLCIGGTDADGLVVLTREQHIEAHKLLFLENIENQKLYSSYIGVMNYAKKDIGKENSMRLKGKSHPNYRKTKYHWITDGALSKLIPEEEPIPEGWRLGRHSTIIPWNKGKKGIYSQKTLNEIREARMKQTNLNPYGQKGKHWYTDGYKNVTAYQSPGPDWRLGRTMTN